MGPGLWGRECPFSMGEILSPMQCLAVSETFVVVTSKGLGGYFSGIGEVEAMGSVKHHAHGRHTLQQRSPSPLGDQWC